MKGFSIPRCYKPLDFGHGIRTELHHFSDASVIGYGQCSYLRFIDECDLIHCAFVMEKSRVAPWKSVTIPRLKLTAAVCSVRVSVQLRHELDLEIDPEIFWTDSKVVLGYIANETRRFHIFVTNRVQEIQDHTSVDQWRHVESKSNPVDEASRGVKAKEISESKWLSGPSFLWKPEEQWPSNNQENQHISELSSSDPEVKKAVVCSTSRMDSDKNSTGSLIEDRLLYFSDWYRGKRAIALCLRYVRKLCARVQRKKSEALMLPELTVSELSATEKLVIRSAQATAFPEVLTAWKKDTAANQDVNVNAKKGTNTLRKLDPYLDKEGILRVGGRLRRANLSEKIKHPIILPRKGHVTTLIVRYFHERVKHQGKGLTLNEVRSSGFWIIRGSSAISRLISTCVTCKWLRGRVIEQRMSDLPEDRTESCPPFTYCAVAHSQTRRDQGSNFVGARRELMEALAAMDHQRMKSKLLEESCDWFTFKMNVPSASHMGGVWERQIRTVRAVLSSLLHNNGTQLDDESLRTLMCEVEAIVNCRPLTVDQLADSDSPEPLTPNHLLTMKSKVILPPPGIFESQDLYSRKRRGDVCNIWRTFSGRAGERNSF